MSILDKNKTRLNKKILFFSLITSSFLGLGLLFTMTQIKANANDAQSPKQDLLMANNKNQENAITYYNEGTKQMNAGQYPQAINNYNQAIAINPNFAEAYHNRGLTYGMAKEYQKALKDLNIAVELYQQQNNITEAQKAQKIIALVYEEMNKTNNPPRNVQSDVDRQMRDWCRNLINRAYVTCY